MGVVLSASPLLNICPGCEVPFAGPHVTNPNQVVQRSVYEGILATLTAETEPDYPLIAMVRTFLCVSDEKIGGGIMQVCNELTADVR